MSFIEDITKYILVSIFLQDPLYY